jgi:hypothetical protein
MVLVGMVYGFEAFAPFFFLRSNLFADSAHRCWLCEIRGFLNCEIYFFKRDPARFNAIERD